MSIAKHAYARHAMHSAWPARVARVTAPSLAALALVVTPAFAMTATPSSSPSVRTFASPVAVRTITPGNRPEADFLVEVSRDEVRTPIAGWTLGESDRVPKSQVPEKAKRIKKQDKPVVIPGGTGETSKGKKVLKKAVVVTTDGRKVVANLSEGMRSQSLGASVHQANNSGSFDSYPWSQCTWLAAIRRAEIGKPVPPDMGDAKDWANSARRLGMRVSNTPKAGDVVVFQPGQAGADPVYGHVAFVEQVYPDGSFLISESGADLNGGVRARRIWPDEKLDFIE